MAVNSSELANWTSGANLLTEGHTLIPSWGHKDPEEVGASGSAPLPLVILVSRQEAIA